MQLCNPFWAEQNNNQVLYYDDSYSYVTLAQFSPLKQNQVRHWQNISSCQEPCLKPVCDAVCWWLARSFPGRSPPGLAKTPLSALGLKPHNPAEILLHQTGSGQCEHTYKWNHSIWWQVRNGGILISCYFFCVCFKMNIFRPTDGSYVCAELINEPFSSWTQNWVNKFVNVKKQQQLSLVFAAFYTRTYSRYKGYRTKRHFLPIFFCFLNCFCGLSPMLRRRWWEQWV